MGQDKKEEKEIYRILAKLTNMSKRASKKEEPLYEPVKKALQKVFSCLGDYHLEVTAKKRFSNKLKKAFDDVALYMITVERFFPDISGFVKTKYSTDIITVEVKAEEPMIKDVFQTKDYAQIFNAKYSILVSPKAISEERRRLILKRRELISRYGREPVVIIQFDKDTKEFEIDKELYYGSLPEPFRTAYKPTVYFFNPNASKENIVGDRVIVKGKSAYHMGGWVDDLVREGKVKYSLEKLEPDKTYKDWLLKHGFKEISRPPTKEELDP